MRRAIALLVLGGTVLVLAVPAVLGSGGRRLGALCAIASIVVGTALVVRQHRADGAAAGGWWGVADALARTGWGGLGAAIVMTTLVLWSTAPGSGSREDARWLGPLVAAGVAVALIAPIAAGARAAVRREGIERDALLKATSLAFFVTVLGAGAYALFEVMADAPAVSMWTVWSVGMLTWAVASSVLLRRVA
jgi:hypothetical protein